MASRQQITLTNCLDAKEIRKISNFLRNFPAFIDYFEEELVKELAYQGFKEAWAKIEESPLGRNHVMARLKAGDREAEGFHQRVLYTTGDILKNEGYPDFDVNLAVEFGAGIHYNATPNPKAAELGFGVGTFPGQTHAFQDTWYFWQEDENGENGHWAASHGVKATMPLYSAAMKIKDDFFDTADKTMKKAAQEVFSRT